MSRKPRPKPEERAAKRQPDVLSLDEHPELWPLRNAMDWAAHVESAADVRHGAFAFESKRLARLWREAKAALDNGDLPRAKDICGLIAAMTTPRDPAAWEKATGRKPPQNRAELQALWIEAGYTPADFEHRTPRDVFDILEIKLQRRPEADPLLDESNWSVADDPIQHARGLNISRTKFYDLRKNKLIRVRPAGGRRIQVYIPDANKYSDSP